MIRQTTNAGKVLCPKCNGWGISQLSMYYVKSCSLCGGAGVICSDDAPVKTTPYQYETTGENSDAGGPREFFSERER